MTLNEEKFMSRSPKSSELNDPVPSTKISIDVLQCAHVMINLDQFPCNI